MSKRYTIRDAITENRIFLNRIVFLFAFVLLLIAGLIVRLIYLQIEGYEHYTSLSTENRVKISSIPPIRGGIYDRKGRVLAENLPTYNLEILPDKITNKGKDKEKLDDTLTRLQVLLNIPNEKIAEFHKQRKRHKPFIPTPFLSNLTEEEMAKFAVMRPFFPGVEIKVRLTRYYPYDLLTAHVVGYVGRINKKELKSLPEQEYRGTHYIGKVGIEQSYETQLHGKAGYTEEETNAQGRSVNTLKEVESKSGANLHLTLDIDLQKIAYDALEGFNGAVVAIEVKTGNVLAFASRPSFNPNLFVNGISYKAYEALRDSPDRPLFNRALRGQYPPGSTVKPFMGLAGLKYKVITARKSTPCRGFYQVPKDKHRFRDWKHWGHGATNLNKAITQSCDVYFYDLAFQLGINRMYDFMTQFGFNQKTGLDLKGEKKGLFPSREWKKKHKKKMWYPGDSVITGIGQGFSLATPIQLAKATATLANYGQPITPHLVDSLVESNITKPLALETEKKIPLDKNNIEIVIAAMVNVVHGRGGTAGRISKGISYKIAGKTGTAQVFTVKQHETYNQHKLNKKLHDHALFVSFAPASDPQIAVSVIVEHGGHGGSVAAPIAGKVIRSFLNDSNGMDTINDSR
ncbi:MAG: penicillin-binding protein 2 [Methylococcales bacterium]|nr:penicillin-binding protein 2 [Methylococcales bacterium]